jgi:hypothetical protein
MAFPAGDGAKPSTPGCGRMEAQSLDGLTAFGAVALGAMMLFYALEAGSPWFLIAFALACCSASAYGFLQGAWPFAVVEPIGSSVVLRRWWTRRASSLLPPVP